MLQNIPAVNNVLGTNASSFPRRKFEFLALHILVNFDMKCTLSELQYNLPPV